MDQEILRQLIGSFNNKIRLRERDGLQIIQVKDAEEGIEVAQAVLEKILDRKTILFLSGGKTPKELFEQVAQGQQLQVGAVALVDERYGEKFHANSNEKMVQDTGLYRFLELQNIPFYPILQNEKSREVSAEEYDQILRHIFATFPKSVGILGIGLDGHTAGLPAQSSKFKVQNSKLDDYHLVTDFDNFPGDFKERISMTFLGLSMLDILLVLVFGEEKKEALELFFSDGTDEEIPSRFLRKPQIAKKTLLITDREV